MPHAIGKDLMDFDTNAHKRFGLFAKAQAFPGWDKMIRLLSLHSCAVGSTSYRKLIYLRTGLKPAPVTCQRKFGIPIIGP